MSYQQDVFTLISSIIGQNNNIVLPVEIIKFTGDYHTAALLSQLIYWQGKQRDPEDWIYKTYDQWEAELMLSKYQTSRAAKALVKMGILETKVARVRLDNGMYGDRAVHYRLKHDEFAEKFTKHLSNLESKETSLSKVKDLHHPKSSNSTNLPINTEITSKDYDNVSAPPPPDPAPAVSLKVSPPPETSSSLSEDQIIKTLARLFSLVPKQFLKPSVKKTIEKALIIHSEDYAESAIKYTNDHSNGHSWQKYRAYLDKTINHGYADGYQSESQSVDQGPSIDFGKMPDDTLKFMADAGNRLAIEEQKRRESL